MGAKRYYVSGTIHYICCCPKRKHESHHLQGSKPLVMLLFERAVRIESSLKPAAAPENSIQLQKTLLQHWYKKKTTKSNTICKYQYHAAFISLKLRFFKNPF